jgi:DNA-binding winged helix-turn-helix (wHTH) protein
MGAVWGEMGLGEVADHALDQLLHRLRRKLTSASPPTILKTIRGRGIKLEE